MGWILQVYNWITNPSISRLFSSPKLIPKNRWVITQLFLTIVTISSMGPPPWTPGCNWDDILQVDVPNRFGPPWKQLHSSKSRGARVRRNWSLAGSRTWWCQRLQNVTAAGEKLGVLCKFIPYIHMNVTWKMANNVRMGCYKMYLLSGKKITHY